MIMPLLMHQYLSKSFYENVATVVVHHLYLVPADYSVFLKLKASMKTYNIPLLKRYKQERLKQLKTVT